LGVILDTNALSAIADGDRDALAQLGKTSQPAIPVIVLGEYRFGIAQSPHKAAYEKWLEDMLAVSVILEINAATSNLYAEVRLELKRAGTPIPENDIWIATLCRQHRSPLLSQDRHFDLVAGVTRLGW